MGQALPHEFTDYITKMLGCDDAGFADIHATTLNAAIRDRFAVPETCFVMTMALLFWIRVLTA
jgi:hypothetical protein